jgi:hypothetical protein
VLDAGPAACGYEVQCWTLTRIADLVWQRFGARYTLAGMDLLLHRIGWSVQVPARQAAERDEAAIAAWREETWPVIKERRRTWGRRGATPVVRVTGGHNKRAFCRPRKTPSGRNRSRSPSRGSGSARVAPHHSSASAARRRNTWPGNAVLRVQGRKPFQQLDEVSAAGEPAGQHATGGPSVLNGRPLPAGHVTTTGQNR